MGQAALESTRGGCGGGRASWWARSRGKARSSNPIGRVPGGSLTSGGYALLFGIQLLVVLLFVLEPLQSFLGRV